MAEIDGDEENNVIFTTSGVVVKQNPEEADPKDQLLLYYTGHAVYQVFVNCSRAFLQLYDGLVVIVCNANS